MLNQPLFAALDVSLETTTICIMSFDGTITKEAVVATEPDSIAICLGDDLTRIEQIGLEAGLSPSWCATFHAGHNRHPVGNTPGPSCLVSHYHQAQPLRLAFAFWCRASGGVLNRVSRVSIVVPGT